MEFLNEEFEKFIKTQTALGESYKSTERLIAAALKYENHLEKTRKRVKKYRRKKQNESKKTAITNKR